MKKRFSLILSSLALSSLFADHPPVGNVADNYQAWFTGPLLTPSGTVIPPGHYNIEPYIFVTTATGEYNRHWHAEEIRNLQVVNIQVPIQIGLIKRFDIQFIPQSSYQHTRERSSNSIGDLPLSFDYQLLFEDRNGWRPKIKLTAGGKFPIAKYQHLNRDKYGTDAIGSGSWGPFVATTISKLFHIHKYQFLSLRGNFQVNLPNDVHVRGYNAYGGGKGTAGKVRLGTAYTGLLGAEYSLTQNWALACDLQYSHSNKVSFKGVKGIDRNGAEALIGAPSSEQLSIAPAFEYNWNVNVGIIAGVWFSLTGRNASEFYSGVVALNVYN